MEVREGFIVGIFNYCDRWCETCAFTSRCRLFADIAEIEASLDPGLKPVVDAPVLPHEAPPPLPPWMEEMIEEMNKASASAVAVADAAALLPRLPEAHAEIERRAKEYCARVYPVLQALDDAAKDPADPWAVIGWFHTMIPAKVQRAVHSLADAGPEERGWPADHDGSAKVALLGIERSHAAWLVLVERGVVTPREAEPFIGDLVWIGEALERVFPRARAFVRPAFDEPDEVARLLVEERRA
jgi:hypothetical protein